MTREERYRLALESLYEDVTRAIERKRRGPGGQQVHPTVWETATFGLLQEIERTCRHALEVKP